MKDRPADQEDLHWELVKELKLVCPVWQKTRDRAIHPGKQRYDELVDIYICTEEPKVADDEEKKMPQKASIPARHTPKGKAGRPAKNVQFIGGI